MNKLTNDAGSVLVFITLMIVLLMVMVGMGLDTGYLTFSRSMGQRAVDMAALAGAAGLAKGDATAIQSNIQQIMVTGTTNDYVGRSKNVIDPTVNGNNVTLMTYDFTANKITGTTTDITKANGVRVALETTNPWTKTSSNSAVSTPAFLTPLINLFGGGASAAGANNVNVSAVAVAAAQPGLPIALGVSDADICSWVGTNAQIPFDQSTSSKANSPNNSGWTTYLDQSVSKTDIVAAIHQIAACQGTGAVGIGTDICLNNGVQAPDIRAFEELIGTNSDGTQKCYLAPVVDPTSVFNNCNTPIRNYALICPLAVCGPGINGSVNQSMCDPAAKNKYILAKVKRCGITDPNENGLGQCYSLKLVREPSVGM